MEKELIKATQGIVQAKPENRPVEIIDYNISRAEGALKGKAIQDCTEPDVKDKLTLIYSMVGLRVQHYPVGQEKQDLHDYIFLKYGKKTLSEFILAFDLAISGELDLKPDDIKVYDQFTIAYLARIMSAYKVWLQKIWSTRNTKQLVQAEEKPAVPLTKEEKIDWLNEWKRPDITFDLIPIVFYNYLVELKLITVTKKMKWQSVEKATEQIKSILQVEISESSNKVDALKDLAEFEKMEKEGFTGKVKDRILTRAKKLIIADYLSS